MKNSVRTAVARCKAALHSTGRDWNESVEMAAADLPLVLGALNDDQIARRLDVSKAVVKELRLKLSVGPPVEMPSRSPAPSAPSSTPARAAAPRRGRGSWADLDARRAELEAYLSGHTPREAAEQLGLDLGLLRRWTRRRRVPFKRAPPGPRPQARPAGTPSQSARTLSHHANPGRPRAKADPPESLEFYQGMVTGIFRTLSLIFAPKEYPHDTNAPQPR